MSGEFVTRGGVLANMGVTSNFNAVTGVGSINSYFQSNINNDSAGASASSDIVATADNGTESTYYIDMGINSSTYTGGTFGNANDAYVYNLGQNMLIGTGTASKNLYFLTGGVNAATNTRMTILGSNGFVGILNPSPSYTLDVAGTLNATGATTFGSTVIATGNITGLNFLLASDRRKKTDIFPIKTNGIDIEYKEFEFIENPGEKRYGVIAQDLLEKNPEFVSGNEEEGYTVKYIDLLIKEIANMKEEIRILKAKIG